MLTRDEFEELVGRQAEVPRTGLSRDSRLAADLGLDSFGLLELAAALAELGVELNEREWLTVETIGDLYAHYRERAEKSTSVAAATSPPRVAALVGAAEGVAQTGDDPLLPPRLAGQFFRLMPVSPQAMPFLYNLSVAPDIGFRWRYRGSVPPYQKFEQERWHGMLAQFVVESIQTNQPAGHVICYNADLGLGHAYVGAAMAGQYLGSGIAVEPVQLFVNYLFDVWPLRKIYLELPEFNYQQFSSAASRALHIEGRLRDHDYYRGRRWDRLILAAYRPSEVPSSPSADFVH